MAMAPGADRTSVADVEQRGRPHAEGARARTWSRPWLLVSVSLSLLWLLTAGTLALRTQANQSVGADWSLQTEHVRYQLERILQLLADAHTGAQGDAQLRAVLSDMQAEESRLLPLRRAAQAHDQRNALLLLWCSDALGVLLILLAMHFTRRDDARVRRAQGQLATTLRSIADGVIATDADGAVRFMNPVAERLTGWTETGAHGQPLTDVVRIIDEDTGNAIESPARQALAPGGSVQLPAHAILLARDGSARPIADSGAPVIDERGRVQGMVLVFRDVSAERAVKRGLQLREAELQIINDHVRFPIAHLDPQHRYLFVNRAYAERLGRTPDECEGRHVREIAGDAAYDAVRPYIEEALAGHTVEFEVEIPYAGELGSRWMRCIYAPVRDETGAIHSFVAAVTDITDRKQAEKQLQQLFVAVDTEKDRLSLVLNSINDEVWFADPQGRFTLANPAALREFGLTSVQGLGIAGVVEGLLILRPDGSPRPTAQAPPLRALTGEIVLREEEIVRTPRTGTLRHREVSAAPVRDRSGQIIGAVAVVRDITEHKRAETALREADRRKDEFLATLSHELRNPLAPIRTAAQILATPAASPQQYQWAQTVIQRQVTHMSLLLDDLLEVTRITQGKLELKRQQVLLSSVIDAAVETARPVIDGKRHRLNVTLPTTPIWLDADPLRLSQMLSNLLVNAAKYTDPEGHIQVTVASADGRLDIMVRDNGIGLSRESMGRIFDMFSQVSGKSANSEGGLGIGLALVKGLAELHGGSIEVASEGLGRGSQFTIHLPLLPPPGAAGDGARS
jgi:PAS domain S-box-containing protein